MTMAESPSPPPRSWLFVPGANPRYLAKLESARPDAVVLDLEDGVSPTHLDAARERVRTLLSAGDGDTWLPKVVAVRSHRVGHAEFASDLASLGQRLDVLILPKVAAAQEAASAALQLDRVGLGRVGIVATVEAAAALPRLEEILAHPRVVGVAFGAEDFAADVGLPPPPPDVTQQPGARTADEGRAIVLDLARARIVTAAASVGDLWRIDSPLLQLRPEHLAEEAARRSRSFGFTGKFAIHPAHVGPVHAGFRPTAAELAWARAVLGETLSNKGAGGVAGQMVDEAVARQARSVLAAAEGPDA